MQTPFLDIWAVITLLGITQGIFLALTFFTARGNNRLSNVLLGCILLVLSIDMLEIFLCYSNYITYVPLLLNWAEPLTFTYGPLHYLYTRSVIEKDFTLQRKHLWFAIVPITYAILRLPFHLQSNEFKLWDVANAYNRTAASHPEIQPIWWFPEYHFGGMVMDVLSFLWNAPFIALTFALIYSYARQHNARFFSTKNRTLDWIVRAALYISGIFLVFVVMSILMDKDTGDIFIAAAMSVVAYCMSVHMLTHSSIISHKEEAEAEVAKKKYEKSTLRPDTAEESLKKLMQYMETEKPYLNSNFSLPELAGNLSMSTHHISQLINEQVNLNFFDFVNRYRVEEVKKKLHDARFAHIKIEEIAFEAGFNSKSAFNTAFKKFTNITPSQFRKEMRVPE